MDYYEFKGDPPPVLGICLVVVNAFAIFGCGFDIVQVRYKLGLGFFGWEVMVVSVAYASVVVCGYKALFWIEKHMEHELLVTVVLNALLFAAVFTVWVLAVWYLTSWETVLDKMKTIMTYASDLSCFSRYKHC